MVNAGNLIEMAQLGYPGVSTMQRIPFHIKYIALFSVQICSSEVPNTILLIGTWASKYRL